MVSVDRGRPPDHNTRRRLRTFPHRLHLSPELIFSSLEEDTALAIEEMERSPTLLDSMFPSHSPSFFHSPWDLLRSGRRRYQVTSPSSPTWSRPSWTSPRSKYEHLRSPSPEGRVIPIKVEHITDTGRTRIEPSSTKLKSSSKSEQPIVIDDAPVEIPIEFRSASASAEHIKNGISSQSNFIENDHSLRHRRCPSPVVIEDDDISIAKELSLQSYGARRSLFAQNTSVDDKTSNHALRDKTHEVNLSNNSSSNAKGSEGFCPKESPCVSTCNSVAIDDIEIDCSDALEYRSLKSPPPSTSDHSQSLSASKGSHGSAEEEEKEVNPAPSYPVYDTLKDKLVLENRQIDYIRGDGNCFFRALSKQLYGSERYHKTVRSLIVDVIATNKEKFAQFVDGEDVKAHVTRMSEDHSWATTCEIYAAATMLQRDIYMLTPNPSDNNKYSWLHFQPIFTLDVGSGEVSHHPCYITLCNTNGNHYDRVVADHGGCNCFLPHPVMDGVTCSVDLTS